MAQKLLRICIPCFLPLEANDENSSDSEERSTTFNGEVKTEYMVIGDGPVNIDKTTNNNTTRKNIFHINKHIGISLESLKTFWHKNFSSNRELEWFIPTNDDKTQSFKVVGEECYLMVMESGRKVKVVVEYPDGKIQSWHHFCAGEKNEVEMIYKFKMARNESRLNIGFVYENGNMSADTYAHEGEKFVYLPMSEDEKLKVNIFNKGQLQTEYVKVGTDVKIEKDCYGGNVDVLSLEGRLLDNKYFDPFKNFKGVLTTKNMKKEKFCHVVDKVTNV